MHELNIKILGTSNGIIKGGYAAHLLENERVNVLQNLSIGSSHPTVIAHALERSDLSQREEFLLLDVCVNEQRAMSKNRYEQSISVSMFRHFLSYCSENGVTPVVLLLPVLGEDCQLITETTERWKSLCDQYFVRYLDVFELANRFGTAKDLWRDSNHPSIEFSEKIAEETFHIFSELHSENKKHGFFKMARKAINIFRSSSRNPVKEGIFSKLDIIHLNSEKKVVRKTNLLSVDFCVYDESSKLVISSGGDFRILGFALDMAHTHSALKLSGKNIVIQRFDNSYYDEGKKLWYVSWSLLKPVYSQEGKVEVSFLKPKRDGDFLLNDHTPFQPEQRSVIAELESVLVEYV
ncbi:hypothetical protein J3369_03075 [Alteromonas sp. NFXS44]|uniref:hypothetical protein n=1 Tax=Alteromonas sp. NFXS44 TaxID=2818435 RepID=UPI0032DE71A1